MTWESQVQGLSPVLWFRLGEASGNETAEAGGVTVAYTGPPSYGVTGAVGDSDTAMTFTSLQYGTSTATHTLWPASTTTFTMCAWVKCSSFATERIYQHGAPGSQTALYSSDVGFGCYFDTGSGTGNHAVYPSGLNLDDGDWHFVAAVRDGTTLTLYLDGAVPTGGTNTVTSDAMYTSAQTSYIARASGSAPFFEGSIDEIVVLDSALSVSELDALYASAFPPSAQSVPMKLKGYNAAPQATLPMLLKGVTESSASSIPMKLHGLDTSHYRAQSAKWGARVWLDNVDVSNDLTARINITHQENVSGTCRFVLIGSTGTINPNDYERKPIRIEFIGKYSSGTEYYTSVRFTGISSRAVYDPDTGLITVDGTTDLQGQLENTEKDSIAALVGGTWSKHIFNESADGWQYAKDRLSTIPSEIHVNNFGAIVVVPFAAKATADIELTDSHRFNNTLRLQRAIRRDLISRVRINMDFRFTRLRHRKIHCVFTLTQGFCGYLDGDIEIPQRAMIQSAADSNAWTRISPVNFVSIPGPGTVCVPPRAWIGGAEAFCLGASWDAARRWAQTITEEYSVDLIAADVESAIGVQLVEEDYGVEATYDSSDYERITDFSGPPTGSSFSSKTNDWQIDATDAEQDGRTAMEAAQQCAMEKASSEILSRARGNRVTVGAIYDPNITLEKTVRLNTPHFVAKGKVFSYSETLNLLTGQPEMTVVLAISRHGGSGSASSDPLDPLPEPTQPQEQTTSRNYFMQSRAGGVTGAPSDDETWDGWISNAYGAAQTDPDNLYRERFVVAMPEIEKTARDASVVLQSLEYEVEVPQDELTMSY